MRRSPDRQPPQGADSATAASHRPIPPYHPRRSHRRRSRRRRAVQVMNRHRHRGPRALGRRWRRAGGGCGHGLGASPGTAHRPLPHPPQTPLLGGTGGVSETPSAETRVLVPRGRRGGSGGAGGGSAECSHVMRAHSRAREDASAATATAGGTRRRRTSCRWPRQRLPVHRYRPQDAAGGRRRSHSPMAPPPARTPARTSAGPSRRSHSGRRHC